MQIRPITGQDELAVVHDDPDASLWLLRQLAVDSAVAAGLDAGQLTVFESDRLLAAIHRMLYGDRAECRVSCSECGESYEFVLFLRSIIAAQDAERSAFPPDGVWTLPDGRQVRVPRLSDLSAAVSPEALLERLVVAGDPVADPEAVADLLEKEAPVLSVDLESDCPYCEVHQSVRFHIGRYLVAKLAGERPLLLREAHLIASRYGWSHSEIMSLTRDDRQAYAGQIVAERAPVPRRQAQ